MLEIRGGGNGSLFIQDKEFKFRGLMQLYKLIGENFTYIKSKIPFTVFLPEKPDTTYIEEPDYLSTNKTTSILSIDLLPKDLQPYGIISKKGDKVFIKKAIDLIGQEYFIWYDIKSNTLNYNYDTEKGKTGLKPTATEYKKIDKEITAYLKSLE